MKKTYLLLILCLTSFATKAQLILSNDTLTVWKIWDKAPYNSFTDLIRFKNAFYCSFREASSHVSSNNDGKVRILRSEDGNSWKSIVLLNIPGLDLRDAKLSVTPGNRIMVTMAGAVFDKNIVAKSLFPMVSFSDTTGENFSIPQKATISPLSKGSLDWIWRVTWNKGLGYGIDYNMRYTSKDSPKGRDASLFLMKTSDGLNFTKVAKLKVDGFPNESTIRFDERDKMYVLIRRDAEDDLGILAKSNATYKNFSYTKLSFRLGGPNFLFLGNDKLLIGTRKYGKEASTVILATDLNGKVIKSIDLPSGGDTSYPGLLIFENNLWVSYYSVMKENRLYT